MLVTYRGLDRVVHHWNWDKSWVDALDWGVRQTKLPDVDPDLKNLVESYIQALKRIQERIDHDDTEAMYPMD